MPRFARFQRLVIAALSLITASSVSLTAQEAGTQMLDLQWTEQKITIVANDPDYRQRGEKLLAPIVDSVNVGAARTLTTLDHADFAALAQSARISDGLTIAIVKDPVDLEAFAPGSSASSYRLAIIDLYDTSKLDELSDIAATVDDWDFLFLQRQAGQKEYEPEAALFEQVRRGLIGYGDAYPFGNADGVLSNIEFVGYLTRTLGQRLGSSLASTRSMTKQRVVLERLSSDRPLNLLDEVAKRVEQLNADSLMGKKATMVTAKLIQDYFQSCVFCPSAAPLTSKQREIVQEQAIIEAEAEFYDIVSKTRNASGIRTLLASCLRCEFKDQALELLTDIEQEEAIAEDKLAYQSASSISDFQDYLQTCTLCRFKTEAAKSIEELQIQSQERLAFLAAKEENNLVAYEAYLVSCSVCEYAAETKALQEALRTSPQGLAERDSWFDAKEADELSGLTSYVQTCTICEFEGQAKSLIRRLEFEKADELFAQPCMALASSPQYGGVILNRIRAKEALSVCGEAVERLSSHGDLKVALARANIASGAYDTAQTLLSRPEARAIAAGQGMNAYLAYFGIPNFKPNYSRAIDFATQAMSNDDNMGLFVWTLLAGDNRVSAADTLLQEKLEQMARQGSPLGKYMLARKLLAKEEPRPGEVRAAIGYLQNAASDGIVDAQATLASLVENGTVGIDKDEARAARLYLDAYLNGSAVARFAIINKGRDRDRDVMKAMQALLAEQGFYTSTVDGLFGGNTQRAFERALQARFINQP